MTELRRELGGATTLILVINTSKAANERVNRWLGALGNRRDSHRSSWAPWTAAVRQGGALPRRESTAGQRGGGESRRTSTEATRRRTGSSCCTRRTNSLPFVRGRDAASFLPVPKLAVSCRTSRSPDVCFAPARSVCSIARVTAVRTGAHTVVVQDVVVDVEVSDSKWKAVLDGGEVEVRLCLRRLQYHKFVDMQLRCFPALLLFGVRVDRLVMCWSFLGLWLLHRGWLDHS
jgi:hypothetical protein